MTTMTSTATDLRRLGKKELEAADTPQARAELARRKAARRDRGRAYHDALDADVDAALGRIVAMFESGDLPAAVARTVIRRAGPSKPMHSWSLLNQLVVLLHGTTDARGPRQWGQAGRTVNPGARPIAILGPRVVTIREKDADTGEETVVGKSVRGFVGIPVYAVEDTAGDPIVEPDYTPPAMPPLFDAAARLGVRVTWQPGEGQRVRGWYQPGRDAITLLTHDAGVFLHELAHAAHRRVLAARGASLKPGQDTGQEVVAEMVAATLCHLYGLDGHVSNSAAYVAAYAGKNVSRWIARTLADVQQVLALIVPTDDAAGDPAP